MDEDWLFEQHLWRRNKDIKVSLVLHAKTEAEVCHRYLDHLLN